MKVQMLPIDKIIPYVQNPKAHPEAQVKKLAGAIAEFKWDQPIVVDKDMVIIKGHGRLMAAQALGIKTVPVVVADYLTPAQVKAARLSDNRVAESEWFPETLALELKALEEMDFDLGLTGFDKEELEAFLVKPLEDMPSLPSGDKSPFQKMTFTLHDEQAANVKLSLAKAMASGPFDNTGNENKPGNALARICENYLNHE